MRPPRIDDAGFTLLEVIISMVLSIMLIGVLGTSLVVGLRGARATTETVENSADAQAMSNYLPQDIQSAAGPSAITTAASDRTGCADDASATGTSVVRLRWAGDGATPSLSYSADYRIAQDPSAGGNQPDRWRLTRYACTTSPTAANASVTILARNLADPAAHPPVATATATGFTLDLTDIQTDGSTYAFSVSASFRTAAAVGTASPSPSPSPSPTASPTASPSPSPSPTTSPLPAVVSLVNAALRDNPVAGVSDGKIDQIRLNFSATPQASCTTGWSIAGLPAGYVAATTATIITGSTAATIAVTPGPGVATAAVGSSLSFSPAAGCSILPVAALGLTDEAPPVLTGITSTNAGGAAGFGMLELNDTLTLTFSEAVTAPSSGTITETSTSGNDTLTIAGITAAAADLGSTTYVNKNQSGSASTSTLTTATGSNSLTVTVGGTVSNSKLNAGSGALTLTPNSLITDQATTPNTVVAQAFATAATFRAF
ncbi:MAG: hypothetical protein QOI82_2745 [Actinomycetota bacterium]|jgi:Tfp pilus assembly protein PilV|nr:hypothetical protein [Actinomycetota bacterium]